MSLFGANADAAAAVLDKLAAEDASRKELAAKRREESAQQSARNESVPKFLYEFKKSIQAIQVELDVFSDNPNKGPLDATVLKGRLEDIAATLTTVEQQLAEAAYYLPPYDLRQASSQVSELRNQVDTIRTTTAPKRKFAFSKKVNKVKASAAVDINQCSIDHTGSLPSEQTAAAESSSQSFGTASIRGCLSTPQVVLKTAREVEGRDQVVEDLANCIVVIMGQIPALRLRRLQNCQVITGAVTGATFIDDVNHSVIMLASYQVRIHTSEHTDFYLITRSRPIIEHCHGVRFGHYLPHADNPLCNQILAEFAAGDSVWSEVEDFNWIKTSQSPHWSLLPDSETLSCVLPPQAIQTTGIQDGH